MNTPTIRIVIADDHELLLEGFINFLHVGTPFKVVGSAPNGLELIEQVEKHKPDVVITDIIMPTMDGIEATKMLSKKFNDIPVLVYSMLDNEGYIVKVLEAGAKGYIVKSAGKEEIVEAINTVYKGDHYYCKTSDRFLIKEIAKSNYNPFKIISCAHDLTNYERKIIQLICMDISTKEIASTLNISFRTVEAHRRNIHQKIGSNSPIGIMLFAIKKGLVPIHQLL